MANLLRRILRDKKLLITVSPRAGVNSTDELIKSIGEYRETSNPNLHHLRQGNLVKVDMEDLTNPSILKIKFVRNSYKRAISSLYGHIHNFQILIIKILSKIF
jgi:hypothetical protein